jgi:hypothetical protein
MVQEASNDVDSGPNSCKDSVDSDLCPEEAKNSAVEAKNADLCAVEANPATAECAVPTSPLSPLIDTDSLNVSFLEEDLVV